MNLRGFYVRKAYKGNDYFYVIDDSNFNSAKVCIKFSY